MRIALIAPEKLPVPPGSGGPVEITINELARRLQGSHHVTVFSPSSPCLAADESAVKIEYCWLPHQSLDQYLEALLQQFDSTTFDLVHVFDRPQFVLSLAPRLTGTKIILHLYSDQLSKDLNQAEVSVCLDQVAAVVTNSHFLRLRTAQMTPRFFAKSRVIHTGVDLSLFSPVWESQVDRSRQRQQLHLQDKRVILCVSDHSSVEGMHILAQALRSLMRQDPSLVLMVLGNSWFSDYTAATPYTRELAQLMQSFKRQICFAGSLALSEMPMIYQLSEFLVCPAQWEEHQGVGILQGMASGLAVVASARGAIPEYVRHGRSGILIPKHSEPAGYGKAIAFLLDNPGIAAELGRQGRSLVERDHRWEKVIEAVEELHQELLAGDQ